MFTLSQLSYWPACHLGKIGLESMRGRRQEGVVADITIYDQKYTLVFRSVRKSLVKTNLLRDIRADW